MTKYPQIDIERLKADANRAETFLNSLNHLTPKRTGNEYRFRESSGLCITKMPNGQWICKNHSDKLDVPDGNVWTFHKRYLKLDPTKADDLQALCRYIADAAGLYFDAYVSEGADINTQQNVTPIKRPVPVIPVYDWKPNKDRALKVTYKYKLAEEHSDQYHRMLMYFIDKGNIPAATLEKYGVQPLDRTYRDDYNRPYRFRKEHFAFIYKAGDNIKYKQPNAPKGKRERYIQSTGNYCFGYDQLPDTGEAVILAAGETDVLAINAHLNKDSVYAICLNSETTTIPDNLIKDLQSRFNRIYVLFDNDKTGEQSMDVAEQEKGIPAIRISDHFKVNDVCDLINEIGRHEFIRWMRFQLFKHLPAQSKDPFDFTPLKAYKAKTKQYLPQGIIQNAISWNDRLLIHAPTGSGKSTALLNIAKDKEFLQNQNIESVIISVPTNNIAEQLYRDALNTDQYPVLMDGSSNEIEHQLKDNASLIICTYDSLKKAAVHVDTSMLVIDEMHLFREHYSFRPQALNDVIDIASIAKKCVLLSATADKVFCTKLNENFKYTYLQIETEIRKDEIVQPILRRSGSEAASIKYVDENHPVGKHLIKKDDTEMLEQMQSLIDRKSTVISNKAGAKENSEYRSIVENGTFSSDFILTTKLLEVGTSIIDQVDTVSLLSPSNENEIQQFAARPRMAGNNNKETIVYTFHKVNDDMEFDLSSYEYPTAIKSSVTISKDLAFAAKDAQLANSDRANSDKDISDHYFNIRYSHLHGKYVPDVLAILAKEEQRKTRLSDIQTIYKRLQDNDPHIIIKQPIIVNMDEMDSTPAPSTKQDALEFFASDYKTAFAAVKHLSKSKYLREQLDDQHAPLTPEAEDLYSNKSLYNDVRDLVKKYISIKPYLPSKVTQEDTIQTILDHHTESKFSLLMSQLQAVYARRNNSGRNKLYDTLFQQMETEIDRKRLSAHRQQRPFEITGYGAKEILEQLDINRMQTNRGTHIRNISSKEAIRIIKTIYAVTYDKSKRKYTIGNLLNYSDILSNKVEMPNLVSSTPKNTQLIE